MAAAVVRSKAPTPMDQLAGETDDVTMLLNLPRRARAEFPIGPHSLLAPMKTAKVDTMIEIDDDDSPLVKQLKQDTWGKVESPRGAT